MNGSNKLKCCISQDWKGLPLDQHSCLLGPFKIFGFVTGIISVITKCIKLTLLQK